MTKQPEVSPFAFSTWVRYLSAVITFSAVMSVSAGENAVDKAFIDFVGINPATQQESDETDESGNEPGSTKTGCCQHPESACAGDVTKDQCDQMDGSFHSDHVCNVKTGKCQRK